MKRLLSLSTLCLAVGCSTPSLPPVTPQPPPISQTWTNSLRPVEGTMTAGIAIYLPAPASLSLTRLLADAGGIKMSQTAWVIPVLDLNKHLPALTQVGREGGHTTPYVKP